MSGGLAIDTRPVLHLSGAKLRTAMETLVRASEPVGGIEALAAALRLRSDLIADRLATGHIPGLERAAFGEIAQFMPTVRRRIAGLIDHLGWSSVRQAIARLLAEARQPGTADARIAAFQAALQHPETGRTSRGGAPDRFLRDLAAELLHGVLPEHYPLMTRWIWDARANTGVLREIWHDPASDSEQVDHLVIDVPDTHETFLVLREELSQFLSHHGIYRDMIWYVDLLSAQVYGDYVNAQGGAWLKTDFTQEGDPLGHTLRMLGLDKGISRAASHSGAR